MTATDVVSHRAVAGSGSSAVDEDPISTQVVRHGLDAAADQMLVALRRTAFSPVIYDARDFAGSFYDPQFRLLAQMQSLPVFLGALGYCAEAAVARVGGAEVLEPGDVLLSNYAYDTGSHQNDVAVTVPGFYEGELICYAVIKSHYMDVGGAWLFATHTDNIWQEGTIYPGVRIYRRGELNEDLWRTMLINTRMPKNFAGDTIAQAGACRIALEAFNRVVDRYGVERFRQAVEFMFDQSEQVTRSVIESIPDGRYVVEAAADNDGISDDLVPFEVAVEVAGSDIIVDVSNAPPQTEGPINCTPPTIVSCARCAIMALAAGGETANEGHFRPIEVRTRPGTMFHCLPPAPMAMYSWPSIHAIDHIHRALGRRRPGTSPGRARLGRRRVQRLGHQRGRRVLGRRLDSRRRTGRLARARGRRQPACAHLLLGDARNELGGLGVAHAVPDREVRTCHRLGRRGATARRPRHRHALPGSEGVVRHRPVGANQEQAVRIVRRRVSTTEPGLGRPPGRLRHRLLQGKRCPLPARDGNPDGDRRRWRDRPEG